jgi:hypothetical protein
MLLGWFGKTDPIESKDLIASISEPQANRISQHSRAAGHDHGGALTRGLLF